jgi:cytochrome c oxidase subunit III
MMHTTPDRYYVPHGTRWPIIGSLGLFMLLLGTGLWLNQTSAGTTVMILGAVAVAVMIVGWFGTVIRESERGLYNLQVDRSFRWGMSWFIFSEVMFFAVFFAALFYARQLVVPWLAGEGNNFFTHFFLWDNFENSWPTAGPANADLQFETMGAWGIPTLNTAILLSSGVTITIAHHMLRDARRLWLTLWLAATFVLGGTFVVLQATEYVHAYTELNLRLSTGIYGSTFFMLTGFHGLHVTLGTIMLVVIWLRVLRGHFTPDHHFAFEAVAWYWHFVDIVWLGLFIFVYWL